MKTNSPNGAHAPNGTPAPLRVRLMRAAWAMGDTARDRGLSIPADIQQECDISYGPYGVWNLLDVYRPKGIVQALPVIVSVHGGGYFYGNRELYSRYCMNLAQRGFAVVNFDYRLAPEHRFPAPLEDINNVLRWIVAEGAWHGIDSNNLFLVGDSAGAQLVSQYAALWSNPDYAALFPFDVPDIRIRAVGLNCGMYDLAAPDNFEVRGGIMDHYLEEGFDTASPMLRVLDYITAEYPPAHLISAPNDFLVHCCAPMAELLQSRGVETVYKIYGEASDPGAGHVFHVNLRNPDGKQANTDQTAFFRRHLSR